jgi:tRNA A64-2'-O-ribosylphosphate transferase
MSRNRRAREPTLSLLFRLLFCAWRDSRLLTLSRKEIFKRMLHRQNDFYSSLGEIRKSSLEQQLWNRLHSIHLDAMWVSELIETLPKNVLILPNLRAGAWYHSGEEDCHFKSTDGHQNNASLSLRRSNMHIIKHLVQGKSGCMIIDVTRSGKSWPDAFSRTIPIWTCIMNRTAKNLGNVNVDEKLYMHSVVPKSETHHLDQHVIPKFVQQVLTSNLNLEFLKQLKKPLRPIWISRGDNFLKAMFQEELEFYPIVCVMASSSAIQRGNGFDYIQGAGDDEETWSRGLTASQFHRHKNTLMACSTPDALLECIKEIKLETVQLEASYSCIPGLNLAIGNLAASKLFKHVVNASNVPTENDSLFLNIPEGKRGKPKFLAALPIALNWFNNQSTNSPILICCTNGKDHSAGIALAIVSARAQLDPVGWRNSQKLQPVNRSSLQAWLLYVMQHCPIAPSGITLKAINFYFTSI